MIVMVIKYLCTTSDIFLMIDSNKTDIIKWCVDESFAVDNNIKIHSGDMMYLFKDDIYINPSKHNLNTIGWTVAEFVGVNDHMTALIL